MGKLTDTHCHLSLLPDVDSVLERAAKAGVSRMVVPGFDLESSRQAVALAKKRPEIRVAVGVHPHHAMAFDAQQEMELRALATADSVVAVGEIGLDFYRELAPRMPQIQALNAQLRVAEELELPVIIHNREADEELFEVLLEWAPHQTGSLNGRAGVLHAYSGDATDAAAAIEAGFFIGVAGPLTYPSATDLRETIRSLPSDRLLLETDTPYLPPQPHRGQQNEPAYLPLIADQLVRLKGAAIIGETSLNATRLFNWKNGSADTYLP